MLVGLYASMLVCRHVRYSMYIHECEIIMLITEIANPQQRDKYILWKRKLEFGEA